MAGAYRILAHLFAEPGTMAHPDTPPDRFARYAPALFVWLWSTGFIGAKYGLPFAPPFEFLFYRYLVVTVILGALLFFSRIPLPQRVGTWLHLSLIGLLMHGVYIAGVFVAIDRGMSSGIASVIVGVQPLLTAAVAGVLLGERVSLRQYVGLALGFIGLALTVSRSLAQGQLPLFGFVSCVLALFAITLGTVHQKKHGAGVDLRAGAFIQFLASTLAFGVIVLLVEERAVVWDVRFVLTLAWMCLALSIGAISVLWILIQRGAAARVASLFYLVPPVTAVEGFLLFGEALSALQLIGIAVTAGGVALANRP